MSRKFIVALVFVSLASPATAGWVEKTAAVPMAVFGEGVNQEEAGVPVQPGDAGQEDEWAKELEEARGRVKAVEEAKEAEVKSAVKSEPNSAPWITKRDSGNITAGAGGFFALAGAVVGAFVGGTLGYIGAHGSAWTLANTLGGIVAGFFVGGIGLALAGCLLSVLILGGLSLLTDKIRLGFPWDAR